MKNYKSFELTYHNVVVGIVPCIVELLDSAQQPAKVLAGASEAGRIEAKVDLA